MEDKVKEVIQKIRPQLQADGGDIEFVSMQDSEVKVRLKGACHGCPGAQMTLQMGVERALKQQVDQSISVVSV